MKYLQFAPRDSEAELVAQAFASEDQPSASAVGSDVRSEALAGEPAGG